MALLANPYTGDDDPPLTPDEQGPSDLEEAEAIAAGVSHLLPEPRHLRALLLEVQRVRRAREHDRETAAAVCEALDLHLAIVDGRTTIRPRT